MRKPTKMSDKPPCIINVAAGGGYPRGQARLIESLDKHSEVKLAKLMWRDMYPDGCPPHASVPYAFKAYAFKAALDAGFEKIFWMDASAWLAKPWGDFWDMFDANGGALWDAQQPSMGIWTCDAALPKLGCTREESFKVTLVEGLCCGLDFSKPLVKEFWEYYWARACDGSFIGPWRREHAFVSEDERVQGHRHDMPVLSMANVLGDIHGKEVIELLHPPDYFVRWGPEVALNDNTCIYAQGMA